MQKEKVHNFPLRFLSKEQKNSIKKLASKNGRSLNSEINQAINYHIEKNTAKFSGAV